MKAIQSNNIGNNLCILFYSLKFDFVVNFGISNNNFLEPSNLFNERSVCGLLYESRRLSSTLKQMQKVSFERFTLSNKCKTPVYYTHLLSM